MRAYNIRHPIDKKMKFIEHTAARRLAKQRIAKKRLKAEEFASEVEAAIISVFVYGILIAALLVIAKYSYDAWVEVGHIGHEIIMK